MTTEINFDTLHPAIVADIQAQFPGLATVEFYREDRQAIPLPACILDLTEFETADEELDPQTGQLAVNARFEAELIMGFRDAKVKLELRKLAGAFAAWLRLRRWTGQPAGAVQVVGCYKDEFNPRLDQYEVWRVEWTQVLHLGPTVWTNEGVVPTQILGSWRPEIGEANVDDYMPITEGEIIPPMTP
jgi:hypothetical protein